MCQISFIINCQLLTPFTNGPFLQKWAGSTTHRCGTRTMGRTASVRPWNRCLKSCFIFNCQLLTPFTSGPWLHMWAGSTSVPLPMWNPDSGADTKCPAMKGMFKIMIYNQLPTSDTIHKWTLAPEVGRFHIGALTNVEPRHWCGHQVSGHGIQRMCQIMFYKKLPTSDTISKWTISPKVGRCYIGALTDVEPGHWGGHQVSGHATDVSNHVL